MKTVTPILNAADMAATRAFYEAYDATPLDRARALGVRAQLAAALGDTERLAQVRAEMAEIELTVDKLAEHGEWIEAGERLERWRRG